MQETIPDRDRGPTANEEPIFEAELRPHRSLGPTGFLLVLAACASGWIVVGGFALSYGAWPVFGDRKSVV